MLHKIIIILLFISSACLNAGRISFYIDNDFPFDTDRYYTHGWGINISSEALNKSSFARQYSFLSDNFNCILSLNQQIYTPNDRYSPNILVDDFPYSGLLYVNLKSQQYRTNMEITTDFLLGIIGSSALGKETQEAIHSVTPQALNPKGWKNQLSDDILINYSIYAFYPIMSYEILELKPFAGAGIGTLHNYASIGLNMISKIITSDNFAFTLQMKNETMLSLYDTRLQGSFIFSKDEALSNSQTNNIFNIFQITSEITFYKVFFGLDYNFISKQLKSGYPHQYITFEIGYLL